MLPPVEEAVLQNNPDFAALYNTLTTAILSPSGATKSDPSAKERDAVRQRLKEHRLEAAKRHLLIDAISTAHPAEAPARSLQTRKARAPAAHASATLPPELLDLLLLLPPLLTTPSTLPPESMALILSNQPLSSLPDHLPQLAPLVSSALQSSAVQLARLASPSTNASYLHRALPQLPSHAEGLVAALSAAKASLCAARLAAASSLQRLLAAHAEALSLAARALEAKHGGVARSLELRAGEAALAAARQAAVAEARLGGVRDQVYAPREVVEPALAGYARHLRDGQGRLRESIRGLRAELAEYGVGDKERGRTGGEGDGGGKERTMREMARVYRDMGRQIEDVRGDLERLGKA